MATNRQDTEERCHCGAEYAGSDHCPECNCEQYESGDCGHIKASTAWQRAQLAYWIDNAPVTDLLAYATSREQLLKQQELTR